MVARKKNEAMRRRVVEGIERSRRLVDRYRALLVRLHDPLEGAPAMRCRPLGERPRFRTSGGSSG